jgi:tRNA U55 pseudouridine synthase TruB
VDTIDVLDRSSAHLRLRIQCGRGTYIRVIAEDIGKAMGTVAHLTALRREQSGPFVLSGALTASALATIVAGTDDWQSALRRRRGEDRMPWAEREVVRAALTAQIQTPLQALHHLPEVQIDPGMVTLVRNGGRPPPPPPGAERYLLAHGAELIALAHETERGPRLLKVIPAAAS